MDIFFRVFLKFWVLIGLVWVKSYNFLYGSGKIIWLVGCFCNGININLLIGMINWLNVIIKVGILVLFGK